MIDRRACWEHSHLLGDSGRHKTYPVPNVDNITDTKTCSTLTTQPAFERDLARGQLPQQRRGNPINTTRKRSQVCYKCNTHASGSADLRRSYGLWDGGAMTIVPSLRNSSLSWFFATQGAGSSTIIDGKLCLLYLGGLFLRIGCFSSSASVVCLEEMQQRPDRNPIASRFWKRENGEDGEDESQPKCQSKCALGNA